MNYIIEIIMIVIVLTVIMVLIQKNTEHIIGLSKKLTAQEDIISRIAGKQFEDSKSIATLAEDAQELTERVRWNEREINKVKLFAYRQSTMKEVAEDAEDQGI